jgi:hypothetical protein
MEKDFKDTFFNCEVLVTNTVDDALKDVKIHLRDNNNCICNVRWIITNFKGL